MAVPKKRIARSLKLIVHARAVARRSIKQRRERARRPRSTFRLTPHREAAKNRFFESARIPSTEVKVPTELDFISAPVATMEFFHLLRSHICRPGKREVYIDHSGLKKVSPDAALVLMAEMYRAHRVNHRCQKACIFPKSGEITDLLGEVGYYDYFPQSTWTAPSVMKRHFLQHKKGTTIDGSVVKMLVQHFTPVSLLSPEMTSALYAALIECMNNVLEHAYPSTGSPLGYRHWWMLGHVELGTGEMSFSFFDQGFGIPKTIRTRFKDMPWLGPLAPSDSELIQTAVIQGGYSSTKKASKGRGLPTLKRFIDTASDGELGIISHKSICIFHTGKEAQRTDYKLNLPGTLITWNVRNQ